MLCFFFSVSVWDLCYRTGELCNRLASDTQVLQNAVTVCKRFSLFAVNVNSMKVPFPYFCCCNCCLKIGHINNSGPSKTVYCNMVENMFQYLLRVSVATGKFITTCVCCLAQFKPKKDCLSSHFVVVDEIGFLNAFSGEHLHADTLHSADHRLPGVHVHPQRHSHWHSLGRGPRCVSQRCQIR